MGMPATVEQGVWRWYTDVASDGSMVGLAAEETNPTLTTAQMQSGIIRLRVQLVETAGGEATDAVQLQYSQDNTNWRDIADQTVASGDEGVWIRWADGAATDTNTIGSQLLTGTDTSGTYHEDASENETIAASQVLEIDCALQIRWPPPDVTIRFRVLWAGTAISLNGSHTQIQLDTAAAADRGNTITSLPSRVSDGSKNLDVRFAPWPRFFHDGSNWWVFTVDDVNNADSIEYFHADGSGSTSRTFSPSDDAYVDEANATSNFGSNANLYVDGGPAGSLRESWLKFAVHSISNVTSATLRVWAESSSGEAVICSDSTNTSWDENTVTWNTKPTKNSTIASDTVSGGATSGQYEEWDVTSAITGAGVYSFAIHTAGSTNIAWTSSDGASNPPQLVIEYNGPGEWSSASSVSAGGSVEASLYGIHMQIVSGTPVVLTVLRRSSTTRHWIRGTISGTTITWSQIDSATYATERYLHVSADDGNFWWMGGPDSTANGVWAARSSSADSGSAQSSGGSSGLSFGTRHTASDANLTGSNVFRIVGLASNKALCIWSNDSNQLKWALVDDTSGFGTVNTLASTAHVEDWGVVRSGGFVYVAHTDNASDSTGNMVWKVFDESTDTFSTGTSPSQSMTVFGGSDGLPLTADGDDIYVWGVYSDDEGGQSRQIDYRKYTGPDDSGSWGSRTEVTPTGARGNFDYIFTAPSSAGGIIMVGSLFGDDNLIYSDFALEYWTETVSTGQTVTLAQLDNHSLDNPTLTPGNVTASLGLLRTAQVFSLGATATNNVQPDHLNTAALNNPTVSPGNADVVLSQIADRALFDPTLSPGNADIVLDHLSQAAPNAPTIATQNTITLNQLRTAGLNNPTLTPGNVSAILDHLSTAALHDPTIAAAGATIALALLQTAALNNPTLSPGGVSVLLDHLTTAALNNPTLSPGGVTVLLDHLTTAALNDPTLSASNTITLSQLATASLNNPVLSPGGVSIILSLLQTAALNDPTVSSGSGAQSISLALLQTAAVYEPTVTPGGVSVVLDHLNAAALNNPTLSPGGVSVSPDHLNPATLNAPILSPGGVSVAPDHLNPATLNNPTLTAANAIILAQLSTAALFDPTLSPGNVTALLDHLNTSALNDPTITSGLAVVLSQLATAALNNPTLSPGGVSVVLPHLNTAALNDPAVSPGNITVGPALIDQSQLYDLTLSTGGVIVATPHLRSAAVNAPVVSAGGVSIVLPHINNAALGDPTVFQGLTVFPGHINTAAVNSPSVTVGAVIVALAHLAEAGLFDPRIAAILIRTLSGYSLADNTLSGYSLSDNTLSGYSDADNTIEGYSKARGN